MGVAMNEYDEMLEIIRDISEECYCAGWMQYVEYHAFLAMNNGCRYFGRSIISEEQCDRLRELSLKIGHWPMHDKDYQVVFVPLTQFGPLFLQWMNDYFLPNKDCLAKPPSGLVDSSKTEPTSTAPSS